MTDTVFPAGGDSGLSRGEKLAQLIIGSRSWVHRRVDTLDLDASGGTRRSVSLDVTVPPDLVIPGSGKRMVVPLALIEKATLRGLDTSDASGHPLSVLGAEENGVLALELLSQLAPDWMRRSSNLRSRGAHHLRALVHATKESAPTAQDAFTDWIDRSVQAHPDLSADDRADLDVFEQFAKVLANSFLFLVEVDVDLAGTRTVLKYAYDVNAPDAAGGTRTAGFTYEVPDFGFAASQHMEVQIPSGLAFQYMAMVERDTQGNAVADDEDIPQRERNIAHTALSPASRFNTAVLTVDVVPSRQGIYAFTCWAVILVGVAVAAGLALKLHLPQDQLQLPAVLGTDAKIPSPSASILLIGPALMLSWLSRTPEHDLTVMLLGPLRRILLLCALALLLMAVAAAIPLAPLYWNILWGAVAAAWLWALLRWLYFVLDIKRRFPAADSETAKAQPVEWAQKEGGAP